MFSRAPRNPLRSASTFLTVILDNGDVVNNKDGDDNDDSDDDEYIMVTYHDFDDCDDIAYHIIIMIDVIMSNSIIHLIIMIPL